MAEPPRTPPITSPPIRLAVCVSGGGTSLQNLIDLIESKALAATICHVVASRPGIGAIERAQKAQIPVSVAERSQPPSLERFSESVYGPIRNASADLVILAGFLSIINIPPDFEGRVINIHPALIPSFCGKGFFGAAVHRAVRASGVKVTGCTVHFADMTYDTGPIILQETVPVLEEDTPDDIAARVFEAEKRALPRAIQLYTEGRLTIDGPRVHIR